MLVIATMYDLLSILTCLAGLCISFLAVVRLCTRLSPLDNRAEHIYMVFLSLTVSLWALLPLLSDLMLVLPRWKWSALLIMVLSISGYTIYVGLKAMPFLRKYRQVLLLPSILIIVVYGGLFMSGWANQICSLAASIVVGLIFTANAILLIKAAYTLQDKLFKLVALSLAIIAISYIADALMGTGLSSNYFKLLTMVGLLLFIITTGLSALDNAYLKSLHFMNQKIDEVRHELAAQTENIEDVVISLARTIDAKDKYTEGHTERVSQYAVFLGERLGMSDRDLETLRIGALIHDLGKIGIDLNILNKPGKLTEEEFQEIKLHPVLGQQICSPLKALQEVGDIIRHHHEKLDGSGYPDGLQGDQVSQNARIVAIVDIFDALTTERSYRAALTAEEALSIMKQEADQGKLDSLLLQEFEALLLDLGVAN